MLLQSLILCPDQLGYGTTKGPDLSFMYEDTSANLAGTPALPSNVINTRPSIL